MAATPLRGLEYAFTFMRIYDLLRKRGRSIGHDLMIDVNTVILKHYMWAVKENAKARTGLSYRKGLDDEWVRRGAQEELGIPIEDHQVLAVRRFLASLFKEGRTVQDVIRIRRMFFGKLASE